MKIGITKIFNDLPEWLRNDVLGNGSEGLGNDSEGFEKIRNGLLKYEIEIGSMKEEEGSKKEGNDSYFDFINLFNQISGRSFKGEEKSKKQFKARLREGWELKDFDIAIKNLYNSDFHKEKNFKYATPELITRSEKLNMHYNSKDDSTSKLDLVEQKYKNHE